MKKKVICSILMFSLFLGESGGLISSNLKYNPFQTKVVEAKNTTKDKQISQGKIAKQGYEVRLGQMKYLKEYDLFLLETDNCDSIKGQLNKSLKKNEKLSYEIRDDVGILLDKGEVITNKKSFVINKPSMTMGKNILIFNKNDKEDVRFNFASTQGANIDKLLIDKNDSDGDGVINYLEDYYHLDKNNPDTDHDGIDDYTELITSNLDPNKAKTDGKTPDGELDSDNDGIKNSDEIKNGTDLDNSDIDNASNNSINSINESKVGVNNSKNNASRLQKADSLKANEDEDGDGLINCQDSHPFEWDVCDRDLAIFAGLSYEDGSRFIGSMYKASDIGQRPGEGGEKIYFLNAGSIDTNGMDNGISTKWQIVDYENKETMIDSKFSATTFKNGNNIVIAYRGTDDAYGEWINNIVGVGMLNYHSEETEAKKYALRVAKMFPNTNIYITGHSLGGYLAQIGTAELVKNNIEVKKTAYFNGIGLKYNKIMFWSKNEELNNLKKFAKNHELISYEIKGDVVSAIGTHSGKIITFLPSKEAIQNNKDKFTNTKDSDKMSKSCINVLGYLFKANFNEYYKEYQSTSIVEYLYLTHETTSFYYYLFQGRRKV